MNRNGTAHRRARARRKVIVAVGIGVGALLVLIIGLSVGLTRQRRGGDLDQPSSSLPVTTVMTPSPIFTTPSPIVTTPSPIVTDPPVTHVPRLDGNVTTMENYTAAMADASSAEFMSLAFHIATEIDKLYTGSPYEASYNSTIVTSISNASNNKAQLIFAVILNTFTAGEVDDEETFLDDQLGSGNLGTIDITSYTLTSVR